MKYKKSYFHRLNEKQSCIWRADCKEFDGCYSNYISFTTFFRINNRSLYIDWLKYYTNWCVISFAFRLIYCDINTNSIQTLNVQILFMLPCLAPMATWYHVITKILCSTLISLKCVQITRVWSNQKRLE